MSHKSVRGQDQPVAHSISIFLSDYIDAVTDTDSVRARLQQEQTSSQFLSQSQINLGPLLAGILGGFPISKAYLEANLGS